MIRSLREFLLKLAGKRWLQHIFFWTASFVFLLNFFKSSNQIESIDIIYTGLFHISLITAVYLNILLLIPMLLRGGRYLYYLLSATLVIFLCSLFNQLIFDYLVDLFLSGYYFISFYDIDDILKFTFVYVALTTLLKLSKGWFMLMQAETRLLHISKEKSETELMALKSQINPHFLFNSLNNIYSLSLSKSASTPEAILKLSELMRYMLYESNVEYVPLIKELRFLDNFIDLQKIRSEKNSKISYRVNGKPGSSKIAPLIFLPLVENAFKHGIKGDPSGGYVNIRLVIDNGYIDLYIENNLGQVDSVENDSYQGIGLNNVRRRLELLYPGKHELETIEKENSYIVNLRLDLE